MAKHRLLFTFDEDTLLHFDAKYDNLLYTIFNKVEGLNLTLKEFSADGSFFVEPIETLLNKIKKNLDIGADIIQIGDASHLTKKHIAALNKLDIPIIAMDFVECSIDGFEKKDPDDIENILNEILESYVE